MRGLGVGCRFRYVSNLRRGYGGRERFVDAIDADEAGKAIDGRFITRQLAAVYT